MLQKREGRSSTLPEGTGEVLMNEGEKAISGSRQYMQRIVCLDLNRVLGNGKSFPQTRAKSRLDVRLGSAAETWV